MQSSPVPRYLVPPRSKYSPQHLVLKHSQFPFLPQCQRPSFTAIQNNRNRQDYSSIYLDIIIIIIIIIIINRLAAGYYSCTPEMNDVFRVHSVEDRV